MNLAAGSVFPMDGNSSANWLQRTGVPEPGLRQWLSGKESARNAGDAGLTPGSRRPPGEGNGYPLEYSCWDSPTDRGA